MPEGSPGDEVRLSLHLVDRISQQITPDGDPDKDPWLTVQAYNDLSLGRSLGEAIQSRGIKDPKDIQLLMDFSDFLSA